MNTQNNIIEFKYLNTALKIITKKKLKDETL